MSTYVAGRSTGLKINKTAKIIGNGVLSGAKSAKGFLNGLWNGLKGEEPVVKRTATSTTRTRRT